jgi:predicted small lipoprotein YifL
MRAVLASLAVLLFVAGCGYKGPLYLPESKPAAKRPAPAPAQPDASKSGEGAPKE